MSREMPKESTELRASYSGNGGNHGTFSNEQPQSGADEARSSTKVTFAEDHNNNSDEERIFTFQEQCLSLVMELWQIKILLLFVPLTVVAKLFGASEGILFICSFFALIPLAACLGDFTEDVCKRSNEVIGALLNVTFGNATELVISFMALRSGLLNLIKASLIGSVLGNMLLVLGTGLVLGGMKRKVMTFSHAAANTYIPLLMLAVMSFLVPSGYGMTVRQKTLDQKEEADGTILAISRFIALVTAFVYMAYLYFQLVTHRELFNNDDSAASKEKLSDGEVEEDGGSTGSNGEEDDDDDAPKFNAMFAIVGLAVVSILISYCSDVLVDSVEGAARIYNIPDQFIGLILVPIVGNAAEHATAVIMAQKNRLDAAIGVALGSSIQISIFVMPLLVLAGWIVDVPLDLNFHPFPTAVLMVSVLVASQVVGDGKSNWLEGVMLLGAYVMVAGTVYHGNLL